MNLPFRRLENLHIILWLLKDFCWISGYKTLGVIMVAPTILVAIFITYKYKSIAAELWHNLAIVFWISANSIWMTGEFYLDDTARPIALIFFYLGFIAIGYYYLINEPFWKRKN